MKDKGIIFKICVILLAFAMVGGTLISCETEKDDPSKTTEENTDASFTISNEMSIVYPMNAEKALTDKVGALRQSIQQKSGLGLKVSDDYLKSGETAPNGNELLIGYTNREETAAVMNSIGYFDYAIRVVNNKIVIAAHTKEALFVAIDVFYNELLVTQQKDGAEVFVLKEERTAAFVADRVFFTDANPIEGYQLVYPNGSTVLKESAEEVAETLNKNYGIRLKVVSDAEAVSEFEILIGKTNRAEVQDYYTGTASPDPLYGIIRVIGNKVILVGEDENATAITCERFLGDFANNANYTSQFNFANNVNQSFVAYVNDADSALREGADIRVMSYNILTADFSSTTPDITERVGVCSTILNYMPDVVGIQEVSQTGWNFFDQQLGHIYEAVGEKTPNGEWSYTGLLYNTNTVRLITTESTVYSVGNTRIRLFVYGLFEHLESGEQFIVASTHWDVQQKNRPQHASENTDLVNALREKYGLPIITTGDFNANETYLIYRNYLTDTDQKDARDSAQTLGAVPATLIDHVTHTTDLECLFFKQINNGITAVSSDHHPVYADFRFGDSD